MKLQSYETSATLSVWAHTVSNVILNVPVPYLSDSKFLPTSASLIFIYLEVIK